MSPDSNSDISRLAGSRPLVKGKGDTEYKVRIGGSGDETVVVTYDRSPS